MKLDHLSTLRLQVDPAAYLKCARSSQQLIYLLDRLFSGQEIAESELESWGLKITLEDEFIAIRREE